MTVCLVGTPDPEWGEPSPLELLLLEAERPVLEAELAVVAAECAYLASPSSLARARVRRAETDLARLFTSSGRPAPPRLVDPDEGGSAFEEDQEDDDVEGAA